MRKRTISKRSKTDWKRLNAMRDEDIDYSDIPPTTPEQFAEAIVCRGGIKEWLAKEQITLHIDADVLKWFRAQRTGYQTKINAVLRAYMEAHGGRKGAKGTRHR
jgi:uncharacterized protein (DUF4415 family)